MKLLYAQRQLEAACLDRSIDDIEAALQKIYLGNFKFTFNVINMQLLYILSYLFNLHWT